MMQSEAPTPLLVCVWGQPVGVKIVGMAAIVSGTLRLEFLFWQKRECGQQPKSVAALDGSGNARLVLHDYDTWEELHYRGRPARSSEVH